RFGETFFRVQQRLENWEMVQAGNRLFPRRAGISSFGAGGANAHLIVEEFIPLNSAGLPGTKPVLIVLSAKNLDRLKELGRNLAVFLELNIGAKDAGSVAGRTSEPISLRDLAYTLQVGREALDERMALVVQDLRSCIAKLMTWTDGGEIPGLISGNAKRSSAGVSHATLHNGKRSVDAADGSLQELGRLWVTGADIDWQELYPEVQPRRVSLPTYPFARERYWIPQGGVFSAEAANGNGEHSVGLVRAGVQSPADAGGERGVVSQPVEHVTEPVIGNGPDAALETQPEFSVMFFSDNSQVAGRQKYQLVLEAAKFADHRGFTGIWTPERHFHPFGGIYSSPATLTGALAAITQRIRLRAGSVVGPLEDPLRIAEAWSVVDNLSQGRVDVAFASGWNPNDFALNPDAYPRLRDVWLERIPQVRRLWRGESIERINGKGDTVQLRIYPEPCQKELPIWLTASRRVETFIDAGQRGYHVLTMLQGSTLGQLAEKIRRYREARQQAGLDPASGKVTLMLHTFVHRDAGYARQLVREPFLEYIRSSLSAHKTAVPDGDRIKAEDLNKMVEFSYERYCREASLIGDPPGCLAMVEKCREVGVDEIACLLDFGADPASVLKSLPYLEELRALCRVEKQDNREAESSEITL
ncbi:MAG TPA: MupA/Atu3671 family FMN-dependent luciferase-like monooxygenase, partial [Chthoniobacterales bacterium]|nr:MupA/Atu3671 family FMN-dependent luciferase-like monooxygenase [Chthoniobacterales bacterium]